MGYLDDLLSTIKQRPGYVYRAIHLEPGNVARKQARGYTFLKAEDPEIKGTILEKMQGADTHITIGTLAIAKIKKEYYIKHRKAIEAKTRRRLDAIKKAYLQEGETVKRQLGKSHSQISFFAKEED